jgi:hypothetical protein
LPPRARQALSIPSKTTPVGQQALASPTRLKPRASKNDRVEKKGNFWSTMTGSVSEKTPLVTGMIRTRTTTLKDETIAENMSTSFPVLVEAIGCRHLPVWDMESYLVVQYGTQIVHRTKPYVPKMTKTERVSRLVQIFGGNSSNTVSNTARNLNNPIWTIREDSVFSVIVSENDLANHKALTLQVWCRPRPVSLGSKAIALVANSVLGGKTNNMNLVEIDNNENDDEHVDDDVSEAPEEVGDDEDMNAEMTEAADVLRSLHQTKKNTGTTNSSPTKQPCQQQIRNDQIAFIGKVRIPCTKLLQDYCTSERIELPLLDELGRQIVQSGTHFPTTFSFRIRMASSADLNFADTWPKFAQRMTNPVSPTKERYSLTHLLLKEAQVLQEPQRIRATLVTELPEAEMIGASFTSAIAAGSSPTNIFDAISRNKVKVKPYPDAATRETRLKTQYLTKEILKTLTAAPSRKWIQAGSMGDGRDMNSRPQPNNSKYGRLYIEVLSCHGLPNVDYGERLGNQTDCFCAVVYGDAMVETDVIDDELSPHWLPWTQRAFCFALGHPSQVCYLGVFGYKRNPMTHRPIGRVEINISNLQHDTLYDLRYDLKAQSHTYNGRVLNGSIRVRVRVEVDDERQYLLASLTVPPSIYINMTRKKSMRVARYTAMGEYDSQDRFQLSVLQGYVDEILQGYVRRILYALQDGIRSLCLWRNQVSWGQEGKYGFPLYSMLAFIMCVLAVEIPNLIPGMTCLGLALFMLVQMQHRIYRQPIPMKRCFSFWHYLQILVTGSSAPAFDEIKANRGLEELKAIEKALEERIEKDREFFGKKEAVEKVIEEIEHERVTTKVNHVPLEIMVVLGKVQGIVGNVCRIFRLVDTIVTWEESDLAFFLTLALILVGIFVVFIPWAFVLTWTGRIAVVLLLGPQNKIVDLFYYRHIPSDEQKIRKLFMERMLKARVNQEDNRKLKAYRQVLYGKYSTSVPAIVWTPHNDFPRPDSTARYHGAASNIVPRTKDLVKCPFVPGQRLFGHIIPRPEEFYNKNEMESKQGMKQFQQLLKEQRKKKNQADGAKNNDLSGIDVASMASEEGFEVMEMYDEELGYVKNVLSPPREDSSRQLGVEILQNSNDEMLFEDAFRSVHDFGEVARLSDLDSNDESTNEGTVKKNTHRNSLPPSLGESKNGIEITEVSDVERRFLQRSWMGVSSRSLNASLPSVRFSVDDTQGSDAGEMLASIQEMDVEDCKAYFDTNEIFSASGNGVEVTDTFESEVKYIERMLSEDSADIPCSHGEESKDSRGREESNDTRTSGDRFIDNLLSEDSVNTDNESDVADYDGDDDPGKPPLKASANPSTPRGASQTSTVDPDATPRCDNRDLLTMSPRHEPWTGMQPSSSFERDDHGHRKSESARHGHNTQSPRSMASPPSKEVSCCEDDGDYSYDASNDDENVSFSHSTASTMEQARHETTIEMARSADDSSENDLGFEVTER